ncbi:SPAT6 protein, partial [Semnornis frantzii]|nr:SPAT6 protein [Semnornis frantzii]
GIAPKLRFSTNSLITESLLNSGRSHIQDGLNWLQHSTPNGKLQAKLAEKNMFSPEKSRHSLATKSYEQPTIASKSRSPSPYTKRRMCELSKAARQRLAHLNLGPYEFRRETDKPPFVVRRIEQLSPVIKLHTLCPTREVAVEAWSNVDHGLLGFFLQTKSTLGNDFETSGVCSEDMLSNPPDRQSHSAGSLEHSAPPASQKHSPSSVLNRSSLRERLSSGWLSPPNGDEIHKRVKSILRTHSARQHLIFDKTNSSKGNLTKTGEPLQKEPLSMSELQSNSPVQQKAAAHLDNGDYWSSRAAVYKGKPHRAIFEESLEKIYRNMYQKASGIVKDS